MADIVTPEPRLSSHPWNLYQAKNRVESGSRRPHEGFYGQMLSDDLSNQRYAYDISFMPDGLQLSRASELLSALLDDFNHFGYDRDPVDLVCDLTVELLQESSDGNVLLLELHSLPRDWNHTQGRARHQEGANEANERLPSLGLIPNWSVKETRAGYSQALPLDRQRTVIPKTRVHRLALSRQDRSRWTRAVKGTRFVDATKLIDAGIDRLSWEGYSFSEVVVMQNLAVAASTAEIGWDGRGTFAEMATSPYMTFRRLRFRKFWIEALEGSVFFLNQFTTSNALYGQERFSFSLTGLPTPNDLEQAMDKIRSGTLTVEEAHNSYLSPRYSKSI